VGILGFRELLSVALAALVDEGAVLYLEDDVRAFAVALPRLRVVPIDEFDPWALLR
jgi:uncharacterized protein